MLQWSWRISKKYMKQFVPYQPCHYNPRTKGFHGLCSVPAVHCRSYNRDPAEWETRTGKTYRSYCGKCKEHLELEEKNMEIEVGTTVEWSSQAGGCWTTKKGVLLGKIPSEVKPVDIFPWLSELKTSQLSLDPYYPSKNNRYLVEVSIPQKRGIKKVYYGPRMSAVSVVTVEEES